MRISSKRTPAAVLRTILDIKDFEMAELLRCSRETIHSLESGRLKVSESMAVRIFHETGISLKWLIAGDPKTPPVSREGEPYTKAIFDRAQALKDAYDKPPDWMLLDDAFDFCAQLFAILSSASDKSDFYLASYKVEKTLEALRKEFAQDLLPFEETRSMLRGVSTPAKLAFLDKMNAFAVEMGWRQVKTHVKAASGANKAMQPKRSRKPPK